MKITQSQKEEILKILDISEQELKEPVLNSQRMNEIKQHLRSVLSEMSKPKFFRRLA